MTNESEQAKAIEPGDPPWMPKVGDSVVIIFGDSAPIGVNFRPVNVVHALPGWRFLLGDGSDILLDKHITDMQPAAGYVPGSRALALETKLADQDQESQRLRAENAELRKERDDFVYSFLRWKKNDITTEEFEGMFYEAAQQPAETSPVASFPALPIDQADEALIDGLMAKRAVQTSPFPEVAQRSDGASGTELKDYCLDCRSTELAVRYMSCSNPWHRPEPAPQPSAAGVREISDELEGAKS